MAHYSVHSHRFIEGLPACESCSRNVILTCLKVASYKFGLANSLIDLANGGNDFIYLEDPTIPFSGNIGDHLQCAEKQVTHSLQLTESNL